MLIDERCLLRSGRRRATLLAHVLHRPRLALNSLSILGQRDRYRFPPRHALTIGATSNPAARKIENATVLSPPRKCSERTNRPSASEAAMPKIIFGANRTPSSVTRS